MTETYLFEPRPVPGLAVEGETGLYPVSRIFCVGRNYEAHAKEMGGAVDREAPWYFTKSQTAFAASPVALPYPPGTSDYHHEVEMVIAVGAPLWQASAEEAEAAIWGYGVGLDMTRRDRQQDAKDTRRPWDIGKDVEGSAVFAPLTRAAEFAFGPEKRIHLSVNGAIRQDATLAEMVWSPVEILQHLSRYYHLNAGDVILTGTPAGVGAVVAGDVIEAGVEGLASLRLELTAAE